MEPCKCLVLTSADLENAIKGIEGQPSKGRQRMLLVVLVVRVVQQPAPPHKCRTSQWLLLEADPQAFSIDLKSTQGSSDYAGLPGDQHASKQLIG